MTKRAKPKNPQKVIVRTRRQTGPKGRTGNHGRCEDDGCDLQRRHNKRWCPACGKAYETHKEERS